MAGWRMRVWLVITLTAVTVGSTAGAKQTQTAVETGLIVEAVSARSAAARAGMQPGDTILAWATAQSDAKPSAERPIASPLDLLAIQLEQLPRSPIMLIGLRANVRATWTLQTGVFGLTVRPAMTGEMRSLYDSGRELIRGRQVGEGAERWRQAAREADRRGERITSAWLLVKAAAALSNASQWDAADAHFAQAREAAGSLDRPAMMGELHRQHAHSYRARHDLVRAQHEYERALAYDERVQPGSLTCAADFHSLGLVALARGDLAEAERRFAQALAIRESAAPTSAEVAESLNSMAAVAGDRKELDRAESLLRRALAVWEQVGPETLHLAATTHNVGAIAHDRGKLDEAEKYYRRALAIREAAVPDSLTVSLSLNSLALLARERGNLEEAETLHRRALAIQERDAPGGDLIAQSLNNLGIVLRRRGDLNGAEQYQRRTIEFWERLAPNSLDLAAAISNLGNVFQDRGDLEQADAHHRRALALREKIAPDSLLVGLSLNNVGAVAADRRDLATAEDYYVRSLRIKERVAPKSSTTVVTLNNLGDLALNRNDPRTAEKHLTRALAILDEIAPKSLERLTTLNLLATAAEKRRDLSAAQGYEQRAITLGESLAPASRQLAVSLSHLAELRLQLGDTQAAEDYVKRSLTIVGSIAPGSWLEAQALNVQGRIYRSTARKAPALDTFARALDAFEQQSTRVGGADDVRSGFGAAGRGQYQDAVSLALELGRRADAFWFQERFRARTLLAMLAERDLLFAGDVPPDIARDLRLAAAEYDRIVDALSAPGSNKGLLARLREVRETREQLAQRVRQLSPRLAALQYPEPLDLDATRASLDPGTLLLAYWVGPRRTTLFAVEPSSSGRQETGLTVFSLPVGEQRLRTLVRNFRQQIRTGSPQPGAPRAVGRLTGGATSTESLAGEASALYELLLKPAARIIGRHARVVIVPDGPLHSLPFAALRISGNGERPRYFVEWKPLHVAVSATVYAEVRRDRRAPEGSAATRTLVAFGDPSFSGVADSPGQSSRPAVRGLSSAFQLSPLPGTRREVEGIAKLFSGAATVYVGADATEARAKAVGTNASHVHFATHGLLDEKVPLNSALVLTLSDKQPAGEDNGLLQVWEVFEHVRLDADLVTLSACETGLGQELGGEGLVGLTRAFQYAGARSVLATLWSVADRSTSELMSRFYGYLAKGYSKDDALRAAQVDLIRAGGAASHPFHWAAFQLFGAWR